MSQLGHLKTLSAPEIRTFVKENSDNQTFFDEIEQSPELLNFLLANKAISDHILGLFYKDLASLSFLVDSLVKENFVPSMTVVDKLLDFSQDCDFILLKLLKSFPSLVIDNALFLRIINEHCFKSATYLLENNQKFQKTEILLMLAKLKVQDADLIKLLLTKELIDIVFKDISEDPNSCENYQPELISEAIARAEITFTPSGWLDILGKVVLTTEAYNNFFKRFKKPKKEDGSTDYYSPKTIEWNENIENVDPELVWGVISLSDVSESSNHRKFFILKNPDESTDDELVYLVGAVNVPFFKTRALEAALRRPQLVKQLPLDDIEDLISPVQLTKLTKNL